jgi:hypothetical protein
LVGPPSDVICWMAVFIYSMSDGRRGFPTTPLLKGKKIVSSKAGICTSRKGITMKQKGNKKFDVLIYIGIILFCAFLIYQMVQTHP